MKNIKIRAKSNVNYSNIQNQMKATHMYNNRIIERLELTKNVKNQAK